MLHVIQRLTRGGAGRSLLALADASRRLGGFTHSIASLLPAEAGVMPMAESSGAAVVQASSLSELATVMAGVDLVHLHYWNTPELWEVMALPLPPARLLLNLHVGGRYPPHVLTEELCAFADVAVAASPLTSSLPAWREAARVRDREFAVVAGSADFSRLAGYRHLPHEGLVVGYMGTVDFTKMHPRYVAMSAAVTTPGVRFAAYGLGGAHAELRRQAAACGAVDRFDLGGYVEDVATLLGTFDVFGYPLRPDNYSASDIVVQEAMMAGVPPVVLPWGGAACLIEHGVTGLVAADEQDYPRQLEHLLANAEERAHLGRNAAEYARRNFGAARSAEVFHGLWQCLVKRPKRLRRRLPTGPATSTPAGVFVASLGATAPQFAASLAPRSDLDALAADREIARSGPVLASPAAGGILHWRSFYPSDPFLCLWSGLLLLRQRRPALAAAEFDRAARQGVPGWRPWSYLAQAADRAGSATLARTARAEARLRGFSTKLDAAAAELFEGSAGE